jgi:RNA polymerase sigma factor (TIGR02999 family)
LVYDNLRRLAASRMGGMGQGGDWTCQPTAIVHEAYLRMAEQDRVDWRGRTHFFAVGAEMVRRVIVDEARRRGALKRGGDHQRVTLSGVALGASSSAVDPVELDEAMQELARVDPRAARVVSLHFFGGLTHAEIAGLLEVTERTVRSDWRSAKAYLCRHLAGGSREGDGDGR